MIVLSSSPSSSTVLSIFKGAGGNPETKSNLGNPETLNYSESLLFDVVSNGLDASIQIYLDRLFVATVETYLNSCLFLLIVNGKFRIAFWFLTSDDWLASAKRDSIA